MYRPIDIEKEFDSILPAIGGQRVSDLLGNAPATDNADYLFDCDKVIAELKCLQDNKLEDPQLNERLWALLRSWRKQGLKMRLTHDGWRATLNDMPKECSLQFLQIYAKSIRKRIIKANKQIRGTRLALHRPDHKGLLLLANDGNFALDPDHVRHVLGWIMRTDFSSIHTVVFFTVNMPGRASFTNVDTFVWANLHRHETSGVDNRFLERLAGAWMSHLETLLGDKIARIHLTGPDDLARIENLRPAPKDT